MTGVQTCALPILNREIKFRAWNGEEMYVIKYLDCEKCNLKDEDIVMQFTGLKDKNGKEIYDKDILRYKDKDKNIDEIILVSGEYEGYEGCFIAIIKGVMKGYLHEYTYDDLEVIGNIYENEELLK